MGSHDASGKIVLFSGSAAVGGGWTNLSDCWILDGSVWSQYVSLMPQARNRSAMAYDALRQRLVMFGGWTTQGLMNDTWEWDGSTWSQRVIAVNPPARYLHAMAFDPLRTVTVLFGGVSAASGIYLDDVWEWDGTVWTDVTPTTGPGGLASPVLAFDPIRLDIMMHGGTRRVAGTDIVTNDTWSWDGTAWQQQTPTTPPWFRGEERVVTDLHRQRVVLHGGNSGDPFSWEWDGSQWSLRMEVSPGPRNGPAMAYDSSARRVVLFGGESFYGRTNDTWIFATPSMATVTSYGSGCAGSAGTPQLENTPYTLPWIGDTYESQLSNLGATSIGAFFATGYASTQPFNLAVAGMPGCELVVSLTTAEFRSAVAQRAEWQLALPNTTSLSGVTLFQQAFAFDASANATGLTVSNAVAITVGIR